MYNGKHFNKAARLGHRKAVLLLISLIVMLVVGAGSTLAFLVDKTDEVENTFTPSEVTCEVVETFENNIKSNVAIRNTSDIDAYIRAAVVVSWQDREGNVYAATPVEGEDYTITYASNTGWIEAGGFQYYQTAVAKNAETEVLISTCRPLKAGPEGYTLHVEILAQAIQAEPKDAVRDAWGEAIANQLN